MNWKTILTPRAKGLCYRDYAVHSTKDPVLEGERFAQAFLKNRPPTSWNVFLGVGLGYHVQSFYQLLVKNEISPIRMVLVFLDEEERRIFQEYREVEWNLAGEEWILLTLNESEKIQEILKSFAHTPERGHLSLIEYFPIIRIDPEQYQAFSRKVQEWLSYEMQNLLTVEYFTPLWAKNFLYNLPFTSSGFSVRLNGDVILVSAGASLAQNLSFLKNHKGKVPIVAVDTALGTLLAEDIIPDIVVACDAQIDNYYDFFCLFPNKDRLKEEGVILIGNMTQYHGISPLFSRHIFFPTEGILEPWTPLFLRKDLPTLLSGGSVASFSLSALFHLGARRFTLVGQDLENRPLTHVVSSAQHQRRIFSNHRWEPFFNHLQPWLKFPDIPARTPMLENLSHWMRDFFRYFQVQGLHKDPVRDLEGIPRYAGESLRGFMEIREDLSKKMHRWECPSLIKRIFSGEIPEIWVSRRNELGMEEEIILKDLFLKEEKRQEYSTRRLEYQRYVKKTLTQIQSRICGKGKE